MKKVLLTTFAVIFALATYAQCPVEPYINTNYLKDAKILALREIQSNPEDPDYNNPTIPESRYQSYLEGLSTIYSNPDNLIVADSMFVAFEIHANPEYNIRTPYNTIQFSVNTSTDWVSTLKNSGISGNSDLDSFMATYNFSVQSYIDLTGAGVTYFQLSTPDILNITALEDDLTSISGIINAEGEVAIEERLNYTGIDYTVEGTWGSDSAETADIRVENNIYSFWLYAGDCLAGCLYGKSYDFQVNDDCTFLPMATDDVALTKVQVYPNPASDFIRIENAQQIQKVNIFNINGALVVETANTDTIAVSHLNKGVYFVKLIADNGASITRKFVRM